MPAIAPNAIGHMTPRRARISAMTASGIPAHEPKLIHDCEAAP